MPSWNELVIAAIERRQLNRLTGRTAPGNQPKPLIQCGTRSALERMEPFLRLRKNPKPRRRPGELLFANRHKSPNAMLKYLKWKERG